MSERLELMRARHLLVVALSIYPCIEHCFNEYVAQAAKRAADLRKPVAYKVYERERQNHYVRTQVSCSAAYLSRSHKYKGAERGERGKSGYESNGHCPRLSYCSGTVRANVDSLVWGRGFRHRKPRL
jgi:hypothetical protein